MRKSQEIKEESIILRMRLFHTEAPWFGGHSAVEWRVCFLRSEIDYGECSIHTVLY